VKGSIQTERDTTVAVEAYLHKNQIRTADAFRPDQLKPQTLWLTEV
jgi:hypothetical protein